MSEWMGTSHAKDAFLKHACLCWNPPPNVCFLHNVAIDVFWPAHSGNRGWRSEYIVVVMEEGYKLRVAFQLFVV